MPDEKPHYHKTPNGLVQCFHHCKSLLRDPRYWAGMIVGNTLGFPLEHFLYEKVWPFKLITHWLGL